MSPTTTFPGSSLGSFGQPPDHFCASTSPQKNGEQRQAGTHWLTARMKHLGGESHPWLRKMSSTRQMSSITWAPVASGFPAQTEITEQGSIAATYLARKGTTGPEPG